MGNANGREEGDGQSGVEEGDDAQVSMVDRDVARGGEYMGQSPPSSPRASQSPLLFRPQMPVAPLQRPGELHIPCLTSLQTSSDYEDLCNEHCVPTVITWSYGGKEVAVEGSWDDWKMRKPLQRSGKDFTIMKVLPTGVYQYRFIVDGQRRYSPDLPWEQDESGNAYNILDLQILMQLRAGLTYLTQQGFVMCCRITFQKILTAFLDLNRHNPQIPATTTCSLVKRTLERNHQLFLHI